MCFFLALSVGLIFNNFPYHRMLQYLGLIRVFRHILKALYLMFWSFCRTIRPLHNYYILLIWKYFVTVWKTRFKRESDLFSYMEIPIRSLCPKTSLKYKLWRFPQRSGSMLFPRVSSANTIFVLFPFLPLALVSPLCISPQLTQVVTGINWHEPSLSLFWAWDDEDLWMVAGVKR